MSTLFKHQINTSSTSGMGSTARYSTSNTASCNNNSRKNDCDKNHLLGYKLKSLRKAKGLIYATIILPDLTQIVIVTDNSNYFCIRVDAKTLVDIAEKGSNWENSDLHLFWINHLKVPFGVLGHVIIPKGYDGGNPAIENPLVTHSFDQYYSLLDYSMKLRLLGIPAKKSIILELLIYRCLDEDGNPDEAGMIDLSEPYSDFTDWKSFEELSDLIKLRRNNSKKI